MILDDDLELLENLKEILENNSFTVFTASTPQEALDVLEEKSPNVLLIDFLMPDTDGIAFLKKIREENKLIRIILMTAFSTIELAVDAIKKGANDFVAKPFKKGELIAKINKTLEELKFTLTCCRENDIDEILSCLSNKMRRDILLLLMKNKMRFMDIVRTLELGDHTKLNFHLKNLIKNGLIVHNNHFYSITEKGTNAIKCINKLA